MFGRETRMLLRHYLDQGKTKSAMARELGVREVIASVARAGYAGEAGYRRRGRDWRLDAARNDR